MFIDPKSGEEKSNVLRLEPTRWGLRVMVSSHDGAQWRCVFLSEQHEKEILDFLLMRSPRHAPVLPVASTKPIIQEKRGTSWWTTERRAAHAEKMRAIRLDQIAKKAAAS